jgi:pyrroloquinoline quinone biosynthesis protein E
MGVINKSEFPLLRDWVTSGKQNLFISKLYSSGVLSSDSESEVVQRERLGRLLEEAENCRAPLRSYRVPKIIHLEITSRCSLRCPQCYNYLSPKQDLPLDTIYSYLEEAAEWGVFYIALSGGEPLLYPHLTEVVKRIKELGMKSTIATSGLGLTERRLKELADAGLGWVWVSLNGSNEQVHSLSRDGYEEGSRALDLLKKTSMIYGINWVARKDNAPDFPAMVTLAKQYGAKAINILRLKPDGGSYMQNYLEGEKFTDLAEYVKKNSDGSVAIWVESCFSALRTYLYGDQVSGVAAGCSAGRDSLAVDVEGKLRPCRHLKYPESYTSLKEYWLESRRLYQLRTSEDNVAEPCKSCIHLLNCRSCRAYCLDMYGSFYAGEERCPLAKGAPKTL